MYKLYAVRIFTFKWGEAVEFYRDVLGFPLEFCGEEIGWAQFNLSGASIGLERCDDPTDAESQALVGRFVGVSLEVENIDETYKQLVEKGVEFTSAPIKQGWGGTLAHFKDLDGNILTLLG